MASSVGEDQCGDTELGIGIALRATRRTDGDGNPPKRMPPASSQPSNGSHAAAAGSTRKRDDDLGDAIDSGGNDGNNGKVYPSPYVPEASRYLEGSIQGLRPAFLKDAPKFDLIVLDPPWPSRSVKRKKASYKIAYDMQEMRDLLSLIPVAAHLKPDGLVAVWVTNKPAVIELVKSQEGMFSQWGLELVGEWIWVKITDSGEPIVGLESTWRKPWERLLIARKRGSSTKIGPERKVIFGVPDLHSRKPNLRQLFAGILPTDYVGLEVFARHVTAGWWSWGDQTLLFQQRHHWVEEDIITGATSAHDPSVDVSIVPPIRLIA
ncbi:hypothetical protein PG997_007397 [Apiospora hydei]|uniref:MT-A70-domain-containing protein n=1 Tax=Apiospora hydei TaxID=1337664 RepID=A0ABR1WBM3_9PEZI